MVRPIFKTTSIPAPVGRLDVAPSTTIFDLANLLVANTKRFCKSPNLFVFIKPRPYFKNLGSIQFSGQTAFTKICRSMPNSVLHICGWRVVTKIVERVIRCVSIVMASHKTIWFSPDKREHNYVMHADNADGIFLTQRDLLSSLSVNNRRQNLSFNVPSNSALRNYGSIKAADSAQIGRLIKTFVTRDSFPIFLHVFAPLIHYKRGVQW